MALARQLAALALVAMVGAAVECSASGVRAGVSKVDIEPPVGVPLAGYSARHSKLWPLPRLKLHASDKYTTWMEPSVGTRDPVFAKALVVEDVAGSRIAHVTIDAIGADGGLTKRAFAAAQRMGYTLPLERTLFHASHSHSSFGAVSTAFLWEIAPAIDLLVPEFADYVANKIARAMVEAEQALAPARIGLRMASMTGVTRNRRAHESPYVNESSIDPHLGIFRVDHAATGEVMATVWNYAIHGTCLGADNLHVSGDIMGAANRDIESRVGGVSLFINSDAGDIAPLCGGANMTTAAVIGKNVAAARAGTPALQDLRLSVAQRVVDMGPTNLNLTLDRLGMCHKKPAVAHGGIDVCSVFKHLDLNLHLGPSWVETVARYTAVHASTGGQSFAMVTLPGEALSKVGSQIRADAAQLGFHTVFELGYTNDHQGYCADPLEYDVGGYESMLTFWGREQSLTWRAAARGVLSDLPQAARA